ncbi:MAG TPA: hypothetical protein VKA38_14125 [Draconibacterium sp.]|nr:hypothetical protein [Draconibacterium sp.]
MRIAVIDLGTNTCNLLIAETNSPTYEILHQSKQLVRLGDDKIKTNEISFEATARVIQSFDIHKKIMQKFEVDKTRVIGTSAIRTAANKIGFLEEIAEKTGLLVKVVSGEEEAELIFKGVLLAFNELINPSVILDIGGGSNELILAKNKEMLWKESQATGMARIINKFQISDPILPKEILKLKGYFSEEHKNAFQQSKFNSVQSLIGCSGAFDTICDIIDQVNPGDKQRTTQNISLDEFYRIYEILLRSTRQQRLTMKGMDMVRVDLIVPAVILIEALISDIGIKQITQTDFALREGVLFEMITK